MSIIFTSPASTLLLIALGFLLTSVYPLPLSACVWVGWAPHLYSQAPLRVGLWHRSGQRSHNSPFPWFRKGHGTQTRPMRLHFLKIPKFLERSPFPLAFLKVAHVVWLLLVSSCGACLKVKPTQEEVKPEDGERLGPPYILGALGSSLPERLYP